MTKTTWNLSPLFKSDADPAIAIARKTAQSQVDRFVKKWQGTQGYLTRSTDLLRALEEHEKLWEEVGCNHHEVFYFSLRHEQNETDPKIKARLTQATDLGKELSNKLNFFVLSLGQIPAAQQHKFLKDPRLKKYHQFLKRIFDEAKYLLSQKEENILTLYHGPASNNWMRMTSSLLAKEEVKIKDEDGKVISANLNQLIHLLSSQKKPVRDTANQEVNRILAKHLDVAENELNSILEEKRISDQLRQFSRPDSSRHLSDDISSKTVDTLTEVINHHFVVAQKYYHLKAQLLKVPKLKYHERNIEIATIKTKYPYEQAQELVLQTFARLDPEFSEITQRFIVEGRIDVFPRSGKSGGAFCAAGLKSQPIFILLNHSDRLDDVLTMAHELGHGINYELSKQHQPGTYYDVSLAVAEVASTFMEDFVLDHILQTANEQTQLDLLLMKLNSDISTIFRQIACYQFEQELHITFRKNGYLSHPEIGKIFQKHMAAYMGKSVEQSEGSQNWWVYWSHIRNFFYVYSYANGLLIAKALQRQVKQDPGFIHQVKQFLAAGTSESPEQIFSRLGIDITSPKFWEEGIAEIESNLKLARQLAKKLHRI